MKRVVQRAKLYFEEITNIAKQHCPILSLVKYSPKKKTWRLYIVNDIELRLKIYATLNVNTAAPNFYFDGQIFGLCYASTTFSKKVHYTIYF